MSSFFNLKRIGCVLAAAGLLAVPAFAQQQPGDRYDRSLDRTYRYGDTEDGRFRLRAGDQRVAGEQRYYGAEPVPMDYDRQRFGGQQQTYGIDDYDRQRQDMRRYDDRYDRQSYQQRQWRDRGEAGRAWTVDPSDRYREFDYPIDEDLRRMSREDRMRYETQRQRQYRDAYGVDRGYDFVERDYPSPMQYDRDWYPVPREYDRQRMQYQQTRPQWQAQQQWRDQQWRDQQQRQRDQWQAQQRTQFDRDAWQRQAQQRGQGGWYYDEQEMVWRRVNPNAVFNGQQFQQYGTERWDLDLDQQQQQQRQRFDQQQMNQRSRQFQDDQHWQSQSRRDQQGQTNYQR